jgi:hypothetical protein
MFDNKVESNESVVIVYIIQLRNPKSDLGGISWRNIKQYGG